MCKAVILVHIRATPWTDLPKISLTESTLQEWAGYTKKLCMLQNIQGFKASKVMTRQDKLQIVNVVKH